MLCEGCRHCWHGRLPTRKNKPQLRNREVEHLQLPNGFKNALVFTKEELSQTKLFQIWVT